ncbi:MAG: bifunctional UDP-N-acetylglucosamine diphosphorylase/glucosamine-1-phosphate N-acetyltransferase GlmU [Actinomycetota bacterium]|nr:bifunctional UDP-N-acetylglucosamine diphosphorylase/glucosamine-1-phosphate N-acetyltransferase GlmU [Actinomycetota bacterium]
MPDAHPAAVVILAAGEGTRMRSTTPKVLHEICGRTLLGHVLAAAEPLKADHTVVVVGSGRDRVADLLRREAPDAQPVVQADQNGTGHAVRLAMQAIPDVAGTVLVLPGDAPLLTTELLATLVEQHVGEEDAATLLTAVLPDPTGYGRVIRDSSGAVTRVVEHRDAIPAELDVTEVGTSVYAFEAALLRAALDRIGTDNVQSEEYLPDTIGLLVADGYAVGAVRAPDSRETEGVNDRVQLAAARRRLRDRLLEQWMRDGVTVVDPETTWIDVGVRIERDAVVYPSTQLLGRTRVGSRAQVGPDCTLVDTAVGEGARVIRAHCEGADVGPDANVGPYAYLRPGTLVGRGAKVGTFVEVKNSDLGEGAKVPHLTYVGDASIGEGTNIGASSVFVNYDGVTKHRSAIGAHARTGADNMFVAPVSVGDGAYTAAGTVVIDDVPPGAMAVSRTPQRNIEGWVERRRPGTPAADAAARARRAAEEGLPTSESAVTPGAGVDPVSPGQEESSS